LAFAGVRHCRPFCQGFSAKRRMSERNCVSPEPRKALRGEVEFFDRPQRAARNLKMD